MELFKNYKFAYTGEANDDIYFLQNEHLKNKEMWKMFVLQYKTYLDTPANEKKGNGKWFGGWRGEYWGKMLRGAVFIYNYTQDSELYGILEETVRDILSTQDNYGRISTYLKEEEFGLWDLWCRKYVILGLEYFLDICKDENLKSDIITALIKCSDAVVKNIGDGKRSILESGHPVLGGLNAASILEPIVKLYSLTKEERYLTFAKYIVKTGFSSLENIYENMLNSKKHPYEFQVRKAYEMISCFEGLLELYKVTNNVDYLTAVKNFVDDVIKTDVTVIGGCGCDHERFDNSLVTQTDESVTTLKNETCVTVTWMKLCLRLFSVTGDTRYSDMFEISGYNGLLGAVNTQKIGFDFESIEKYKGIYKNNVKNGINDNGLPFDSYSPLLPGFRGRGVGGLKKMQNETYYGCCACNGCVSLGLFLDASILKDGNGLFFNSYFNGNAEVELNGRKVCLSIKTRYPYGNSVSIEILSDIDTNTAFSFRIPEFSKVTEIVCNGKTETVLAQKHTISRVWKKGDKIDILFDLNPRSFTQNGFSAFNYGPILLGFDERFGYNLDETFDINVNEIKFTDINSLNEAYFSVGLKNGKSIECVNYSSAGKNWYNGKRIAAFVRTDKNRKTVASDTVIKDDLV